MQVIGTKYQIFEGEELKVRRLVKAKDDSTYVLKENGVEQKIIVTDKDLADKYVRLTPDAFLNIMITREPEFEGNDINDVYFCVNRASDIAMGIQQPALILRQNIYSKFKNVASALFSDVYIGECGTVVNSSKEELMEFMSFESILKQFSVALYLDDSEADILKCIPNKLKKEINATLCEIKSFVPEMCKGATESIEQLWEENDFIGNYKSIFNITQIDFPIVLGKESYNAEGDIILNEKQKKRLEDVLRRYISNIRVIKYDKDIDISKIVNIQHVVVSDSNNDIYLIAYEVDGYYAEDDSQAQILESFGLTSQNV
jgi:hypothetical protein